MTSDIYQLNKDISNINQELVSTDRRLTKIQADKDNFIKDKTRIENELKEISNILVDLNNKKVYNNKEDCDLRKHLDVISKMTTLVKRDFRGFLLTNVINFIDKKSKEYSMQIFNTDEIEFKLDGNNIDIIFCNKDYENLSGGEKQRVDLIIQFAIRDMLCNYLNFSSNILVLDEITDALDSVSCDRVLNFITKELNYIESVFIISHHSDELEIPYDTEIVVTKNEFGVSSIN